MIRRRYAAVVVALSLASSPAWAQSDGDKTTARNLFFEAREAFDAHDYARASELFARSNELYPAPTAALGLSRALTAQGRLVGAYEALTSALARGAPADASPAFKQALADASDERAALEPRLAAIVVRVRGPAAPTVTLDGAPLRAASLGVKRLADPGRHELSVRAEGFEPDARVVEVAEGEVRQVEVTLRAASATVRPPVAPADRPPPHGPSSLRIAGLVVGGVGVASLIGAAVTGGMYLLAKSTVDASCTEGPAAGTFSCADATGPDAASRGRTLGWINAVTLVGGVAATGLGVTLFVVGGSSSGAEVRANTRGVLVGGTF